MFNSSNFLLVYAAQLGAAPVMGTYGVFVLRASDALTYINDVTSKGTPVVPSVPICGKLWWGNTIAQSLPVGNFSINGCDMSGAPYALNCEDVGIRTSNIIFSATTRCSYSRFQVTMVRSTT